MEITVKIDDNNFIKLDVENDEYRFVEGSERNAVVSSKGEILKRYCKSRGIKERNDYYEYVHPNISGPGYLQVGIPRKGMALVHRIVAETFIENPRGCREVDHLNRNKLDNRVENLRWVTHEENQANLSKATKKTYWRDITAKDLTTGKRYRFKKFSDIKSFALRYNWGKGWSIPIRRKLGQGGGVAYGFFWTAKTRETKNIG